MALAERAGFRSETITIALAAVQQRYVTPLADLVPAPGAGGGSSVDDDNPIDPTIALQNKWGTKLGQLWVVPSATVPGREHRLMCGDCRDPVAVKRLHGDERPDLGLHDPPYGVKERTDRASKGRGKPFGSKAKRSKNRALARSNDFPAVIGDDKPFDPEHLLRAFSRLVLWGANHYAPRLPSSASWIVWDKREGGTRDDNADAELAWSNLGGPVRLIHHLWRGMIKRSERGERRLHPTQKPVAVQQQLVEWHTKPGAIVADWYLGAGAVILACENTGRIGHGMELSPAYLAATLERLERRGLKPGLVG